MSSIDTYLEQIKQAVYGKDVRDAIYNSIKECYDDTSTSTTKADSAATRATTAADAANAVSSMAVGFAPYVAFDILASADKSTKTNNGVTYTWNGNQMVVDGRLSTGATYSMVSIYNKADSLPFGVKPGATLRMVNDITPCWLGVNYYVDGAWGQNITFVRTVGRIGVVPENATGMRIYEGVSDIYMNSETYGHAEVNPVIMDNAILTSQELQKRIDNTFPFYGALPSSATYDLDNLDMEGTYVMPVSGTYLNAPPGFNTQYGASFLFVYPTIRTYGSKYNGTIAQKLSQPRAGDWIRVRSNETDWGPWRRQSLPGAPSTDGTYNLKCTVSNGVASYSWVRI